MEVFNALINIVSKQKVQHIDVFGPNQNPNLLVNQLYSAFEKKEIKSIEDIAEKFYPGNKNKIKYAQSLRKKLENKLINTLFFIDTQKFSRNEYENHLVRSYVILSAIKILKSKGFSSAASKFSEEVISKALRFDLTEIVYVLATDLAKHFTVYNFSKKKSKYYLAIADEYAEVFYYENKANKLFTFFAFYISQNLESDKIIYTDVILSELSAIIKKIDVINSYHFNFQARTALYFKAYLEKDIDTMINISKKAVTFFKTKSGFSKGAEFSFLQKLGMAYQVSKNYRQAIIVYDQVFAINPSEGKPAWYNIRNHLFNSHLQLKEYQQAYKYLLEATTHKSFAKLYELYKEPWIIKEAYMHLLIKMKKVQEDKNAETRLRPFRIGRFLNEVEHFSKDKRGLNISVHIIHSLFLFIQKEEDALEKRLDSLGQYSFRYLRNDETLRSNAFIKMLQKLPSSGYNSKRLIRYADKYYQRLIAAPQIIGENSKEVEVIPYEHLWDIVIELLDMRERREI